MQSWISGNNRVHLSTTHGDYSWDLQELELSRQNHTFTQTVLRKLLKEDRDIINQCLHAIEYEILRVR